MESLYSEAGHECTYIVEQK